MSLFPLCLFALCTSVLYPVHLLGSQVSYFLLTSLGVTTRDAFVTRRGRVYLQRANMGPHFHLDLDTVTHLLLY